MAESWATNEGTRKSMLSNKRRDTATELAVRRLLHNRGLRYRVDFAPLPNMRRRRADIAFTQAKLAVFIDGCFWHSCPEHASSPKRNVDYWVPKLARNVERDGETNLALEDAGWRVKRFWEHERPTYVADQIEAAYREARF